MVKIASWVWEVYFFNNQQFAGEHMDDHETMPTPQLILIQRQLEIENNCAEKEKQKRVIKENTQKNIFSAFSMWEAEFQQFFQDLTPYYITPNAIHEVKKYIYTEGILLYFSTYRDILRTAFLGVQNQWRLDITAEDMRKFRLYCFQHLYLPHLTQFIQPGCQTTAQTVYRTFIDSIANAHEAFDAVQAQIVNKAHGELLRKKQSGDETPLDIAEFCRLEYERTIKRCETGAADSHPVTAMIQNKPLTLQVEIPLTLESRQKLAKDLNAHMLMTWEWEQYLAGKGLMLGENNRYDVKPTSYSKP
jgi:hypothetical protein